MDLKDKVYFHTEHHSRNMGLLTEEEQQLLILKFIVGLPTKNVARIMAKREGELCALQIRALQTLARYLKEKELI